jgi:Fe-S cluster assembly ATPase SufC
MLQIENLHPRVAGKPILNGVSLPVHAVEVQKLLGISFEGSVR